MDEGKIKEAARLFLEGIGEDPAREGLLQTPERIARMCHELFAGYTASAEEHLATRFAAPGGGIVVERDIRFYSVCEHHLLPFFGRAAIAYLPQGEVVGLSKLARTVEVFARRLQLQERLTAQVADAVAQSISPRGVLVVTEAEHLCMTMRGARAAGSRTQTSALRGGMRSDPRTRAEVLSLLTGK